MLIKGWEHYYDRDSYGREKLHKMRFKKSFKPKMANHIDISAVYYEFYENTSINYKLHTYIRFFPDGQYAIFASSTNHRDINNLNEASTIGYYNIRNNKLLLERPSHKLAYYGRVIQKYKILENGNLQGEFKGIYKKIKPEKLQEVYKKNELKNTRVYPDW